MNRRESWRVLALAVLLSSGAAQAGDHPPAEPVPPLGSAVHRIFNIQAAVAGQDRFVFYDLEWLKDSPQLGPAGRAHLDRVIHSLGDTRYPVIIEASPDPQLNQARREFIANVLLASGVPDAALRVVVGQSQAEGLYGEEAVPLYALLITTRFRANTLGRNGVGGSGGIGSIGGLGGLGLGGLGAGGAVLGGSAVGGYGLGAGGYGSGYGPTTPTQGYRGLGY